MADSGITLRVEGADKLTLKLGGIAHDIKDLTPAMKDSGEYLTKFYSGEVFASRGGIIGKPWPKLNPRYAVWKARRYPGRPPLVRTGTMIKSFKYKTTPMSARVYNKTDYFQYHQQGAKNVPARVMMALDEQRVRQVGRIIGSYITKSVESA